MLYTSDLFASHVQQPVLLVTAAAATPVSLTEVKEHLKIDGSTEDTYLTNLIYAVTDLYEKYTKRDFVTKTYRQYEHEFLDGLEIRKSPNVTVTSITYADTNNASQTLNSTIYGISFTNDFPVLYLKSGQVWPASYVKPHSIVINFTCGFGAAAAVPYAIKQAILIGVAVLYGARGDCVSSGSEDCGPCAASLNPTAKALLNVYCIKDLNVNKYNVRF